jgi:hypothetical protein
VHNTFDDDPEPINLGLATAGVVLGVALVMYVDVKGRAMQRERYDPNSEERRPLLLPPPLKPSTSNPNMGASNRSYNTDTNGNASCANGVGGGSNDVGDDPGRHALMPRPSRQALALSTVQETREPETREE